MSREHYVMGKDKSYVYFYLSDEAGNRISDGVFYQIIDGRLCSYKLVDSKKKDQRAYRPFADGWSSAPITGITGNEGAERLALGEATKLTPEEARIADAAADELKRDGQTAGIRTVAETLLNIRGKEVLELAERERAERERAERERAERERAERERAERERAERERAERERAERERAERERAERERAERERAERERAERERAERERAERERAERERAERERVATVVTPQNRVGGKGLEGVTRLSEGDMSSLLGETQSGPPPALAPKVKKGPQLGQQQESAATVTRSSTTREESGLSASVRKSSFESRERSRKSSEPIELSESGQGIDWEFGLSTREEIELLRPELDMLEREVAEARRNNERLEMALKAEGRIEATASLEDFVRGASGADKKFFADLGTAVGKALSAKSKGGEARETDAETTARVVVRFIKRHPNAPKLNPAEEKALSAAIAKSFQPHWFMKGLRRLVKDRRPLDVGIALIAVVIQKWALAPAVAAAIQNVIYAVSAIVPSTSPAATLTAVGTALAGAASFIATWTVASTGSTAGAVALGFLLKKLGYHVLPKFFGFGKSLTRQGMIENAVKQAFDKATKRQDINGFIDKVVAKCEKELMPRSSRLRGWLDLEKACPIIRGIHDDIQRAKGMGGGNVTTKEIASELKKRLISAVSPMHPDLLDVLVDAGVQEVVKVMKTERASPTLNDCIDQVVMLARNKARPEDSYREREEGNANAHTRRFSSKSSGLEGDGTEHKSR